MPSCCHGDEYRTLFNSKGAKRASSRYRRRGLQGTQAEVASVLRSVAPRGGSLLEIGGGIGQIPIALLEEGFIAKAINVELSGEWEEAARDLVEERGVGERLDRLVGDFVDIASELPPADIVVMHRVVCCYPDWQAMISAAAALAGGVVALTLPSNRWWTRLGIATGNLYLRARGMSFRGYLHPQDAILALLRSLGFTPMHDRGGLNWRTTVVERSA